ncbi:MAG: ATP-NAD kinase family protein [Candidatus Bathyarchaeota archaeon]|nr:ATP-NAD kinase family protein [Candidatus Bathyarchaeota archaeon]MDH5624145.1 ATP-NAD kinase family protein [Candidatus Bathyarchaeota archaeon]MDH5636194.1 ATP-NAD kinase family protein [Candidatus Bathyarchaeota archaeon]MDH5702032.1 ATP-NAD kinase family protein [Candidatus Bathyarchaeota archaeon]
MSNINDVSLKTVGLIVNPIAGMGGAVGLKGTDGKAILERAIILGAKPIAPARAESFLSELKSFKGKIRLVVGAGRMGEDEARNCGFACVVLEKTKKETTAEDTMKFARRIIDAGADLLVFCGGDGTARDVLNIVGTNLPVLGVPTGVKMHSAVFAVGPRAAARIALEFLWEELPLREAEVMDVDEDAFRKGRVSARLYGYVLTPYEPDLIQGAKMASLMTESEMRNQAAIAIYVIENMKPDVIYIIGPGTTTRTIGDLLDAKKTLLGVDLFCKKKLIAKDVNEKQILEKIKGKTAQIIVTPIGGQGFIFGRGNQQISSAVIHEVGRDNIVVVAAEGKLRSLKSLRVDTGDPSLDDELRGCIKVITDYKKEHMMRIE